MLGRRRGAPQQVSREDAGHTAQKSFCRCVARDLRAPSFPHTCERSRMILGTSPVTQMATVLKPDLSGCLSSCWREPKYRPLSCPQGTVTKPGLQKASQHGTRCPLLPAVLERRSSNGQVQSPVCPQHSAPGLSRRSACGDTLPGAALGSAPQPPGPPRHSHMVPQDGPQHERSPSLTVTRGSESHLALA